MDALRRAARLLRRLFARIPPRRAGAVLICLAAAAAAWALVPRTSGEEVLVAARDVVPGTVLDRGDLRVVEYPAELRPADALASPPEAVGAVAAGGLTAGAPLTSASVLTPGAAARPEGTLLVPVVFGDAQASSAIRPGHRLRVYAAVDPLMDASLAGHAAEDAETAAGDPAEAGDRQDAGMVPAASGALVEDAAVAAVQAQGGGLGQGAVVVTLAVGEQDAASLARASGSHLSFALLN